VKKERYWLLVLIIAIIGIILWQLRKFFLPAPVNFVVLSEKIDSAIKKQIFLWGIDRSDILRTQCETKIIGKDTIPQISEQILIPPAASLEQYRSTLIKILKKAGAQIYHAEIKNNRLYLESGLRKKILSYLTFIPVISKVAIVIDDLGYNRKQLEPFLNLNIPLTYAILPKERYSKILAQELKGQGKETILHLPLEPKNRKENPGKYAILTRMTDYEIVNKFKDNLSSVPGVIGVSNHMGSKFTENEGKMAILLREVKKNNLLFFDSYTTKHSASKKLANKFEIPHLENQIFLDVGTEPTEIEAKFEQLFKAAKQNGQAIAIGHIHSPETAKVLASLIPRFYNEGIKFVRLSQLIQH